MAVSELGVRVWAGGRLEVGEDTSLQFASWEGAQPAQRRKEAGPHSRQRGLTWEWAGSQALLELLGPRTRVQCRLDV